MNFTSFRTPARMSLSAAIALSLLTGCGSPEKPAAPVAPTTSSTNESPAIPPTPAPVATKGLGLAQSKLMIGTGSLQLDQADMKTTEGSVYMATNNDDAAKASKLIVYGSPDVITHFYLVSNLPYADYPDAAKYPDWMQANLKLQNTLLSNLFGGKIPDDVKAGLDWAKDNAGKDKVVTVDKKTVKLSYGADKKMSVDVK